MTDHPAPATYAPAPALRDWLARLAELGGRTGRMGWVWPALLMLTALMVLDALLPAPQDADAAETDGWWWLAAIAALLLLPVTLRRLRDTGLPRWLRALPFVLLVGPFVLTSIFRETRETIELNTPESIGEVPFFVLLEFPIAVAGPLLNAIAVVLVAVASATLGAVLLTGFCLLPTRPQTPRDPPS